MEKLIFPGHIGKLEYIMPALQVYVEADDWVKTADYIDKEFAILKANGIESEMKDDKTDYTKDAELPRYFGFVERRTPGDVKSDCRITELGRLFYDAVKNKKQEDINEAVMTAFETVTFGKNNEGCPGSNTRLEAPNILLIASLMLDGVTRQEYAGVLYDMLNNNAPMVTALVRIKMLRDANSPINDKVRVDNKVIPFLVNVNFLKEEGSMIKLSDSVKQNFRERISKLPPTNELENIFPERKDVNSLTITSEYRPYLTAIKSKPFLLLAGISGTGKSRIVRELARACWDEGSEEYKEHKPRNFEMVQVKPNWHDSSELMGYVSRIGADKDGNGVTFVAGDFLKFIARAWEEQDVPYFLCLDEMNLAPVEQYFAEYLSVVESRKATDEGVVTDPILRKSIEPWYFILCAELTSDDDLRQQFLSNGICIPQNLIVIGTVNMDETTFSFSRKVLDRAMTIEMNEVDLEGGLTERYEAIGKLGTDELIGTCVEGVDVYSAHKGVCDKVIAYLKVVNEKLSGTPFKIAYRTRNEFLLYVVNNLPYNKDEEGKDINQDFIIARALDEITNMKILSRIEGDEAKVSKLFNNDELSNTIKTALADVCAEYDTEASISLAKLKEMKDKLENGYTSFWS